MNAKPGRPLRVNEDNVAGDQENPAIAYGIQDNFVVVWESDDQDDEGGEIYARLYNSGQSMGREFQVNRTTEQDQKTPAVAMSDNGNFVVVWVGNQGNGNDIYAQRHNAKGDRIGTEFQVNEVVEGEHENPAVGMSLNGSFVVVWEATDQDDYINGPDNSGTGIYGQRYNSNGTPLDDPFRVNLTTDNDQSNPAIAVNQDGSFVVVWESRDQDSSGKGIFGQRFDRDGDPIDSEFQINFYITDDQINPVVAVDTVGNFVVAWESQEQDGDGSGIYARSYARNGNARGRDFQVNTTTEGDQSTPAIGMDAEGNFVIAWANDNQDDQPNRDEFDIIAREFNYDGRPRSEEFKANGNTIGDQDTPAIAVQSNGDYVIGWETLDPEDDENNTVGDGDGEGIFAQPFNIPEPPPPGSGTSKGETIQGTDGNDTLSGAGGNDKLIGKKGNDLLQGGTGKDELLGNEGNDTLQGGRGQDTLKGQIGNDLLVGGADNDTLIGGAGNDILAIGQQFGLETIRDFKDTNEEQDLLGLRNRLTFGQLDRRQQQNDTLIFVGADQIARLVGVQATTIDATDFISI
ncbi:MAG: calcium-binding protein [Cyanobacteria bacterium CRU_2_1]|nr:calcium-binding protein [Cyanobacteria bacterium RU_5_0]NJR63418.1 calcium-binding protein [Cyanobacteria bacterium CRU_2_1]